MYAKQTNATDTEGNHDARWLTYMDLTTRGHRPIKKVNVHSNFNRSPRMGRGEENNTMMKFTESR